MNGAFNVRKSAQAAAYLLRLHSGSLDMYIFNKLLYLADRDSIARWGDTITGDDAVSMKYGPVLSQIYDLTKGLGLSYREEWEPYISDEDPDGHRITLQGDPGVGLLSKAEIKILEDIHQKFGSYTFGQMKNFSHGLPEYEHVENTSKRIFPVTRLRVAGKTDEEILEIERIRVEMVTVDAILGE